VALLGTPWAFLSGARRGAYRADHVGYIFQQFNLLAYLSMLDNVLLPCRFSVLRRQQAAGMKCIRQPSRSRRPSGLPCRRARR
jgi:putative ABC transport system ATP-binding protein